MHAYRLGSDPKEETGLLHLREDLPIPIPAEIVRDRNRDAVRVSAHVRRAER